MVIHFVFLHCERRSFLVLFSSDQAPTDSNSRLEAQLKLYNRDPTTLDWAVGAIFLTNLHMLDCFLNVAHIETQGTGLLNTYMEDGP